MNRNLMTAPFAEEELRQFKGRGDKVMTFIEDETVMDRLDAGYGYSNWQVQVEETRVEGVVKVRLGVREHGEWAWYEDFGYPNQKGGDELKEAVSDGIRRCGRYLGIARDLYRKATYEPGGALGPKRRRQPDTTDVEQETGEADENAREQTATVDEQIEFLGKLQKTGTIQKGGAAMYQAQFHQTPEGHTFGFRLKLESDERDIPQVLVTGSYGQALFLAYAGETAGLIGAHVTVKGRLYNVRPKGRRSYYRLVVGEAENDLIETPVVRIPAVVSPLREPDENPEAPSLPLPMEPLSEDEKAAIAGSLA